MTDDFEALEAELRGYRPLATSPALRVRIAERLAEAALSASSLRQRLALAGGLIAAGLALMVVLNLVGPRNRDVPITSRGGAIAGPARPTVRTYRQALARSPAALEAMLDEQAVRSAQPSVNSRPVTAFTASNRNFLTWTGDH
jgi:hypothetical protein